MGITERKGVRMLTVEICMGTACHLMGNQDLMTAIDSLPHEIRDQIEVKGKTCLKNCGKGPNVKINDLVIAGVTPDQLLDIIQANI